MSVTLCMTSALGISSTIFTTTIESPRAVTCGHCNAEITGGSSSNPCIKACKRFRALLPSLSPPLTSHN